MSRFMFGGFPQGVPGNDSFTKVLLHFDGNFTDVNAGGSAKTWTSVGATIASGGKFSSALKGPYITCPVSADMQIGSSDMTVDFWINLNGLSGATNLIGAAPSGAPSGSPFSFLINASGLLTASVILNGTPNSVTSTSNLFSSGWTHIALMKSGTNNVRLTINGIQEAQSTAASGSFPTQTANLSIGRNGDFTGSPMNANALIDEFRFSVGITRWATNFTPPIAAYT